MSRTPPPKQTNKRKIANTLHTTPKMTSIFKVQKKKDNIPPRRRNPRGNRFSQPSSLEVFLARRSAQYSAQHRRTHAHNKRVWRLTSEDARTSARTGGGKGTREKEDRGTNRKRWLAQMATELTPNQYLPLLGVHLPTLCVLPSLGPAKANKEKDSMVKPPFPFKSPILRCLKSASCRSSLPDGTESACPFLLRAREHEVVEAVPPHHDRAQGHHGPDGKHDEARSLVLRGTVRRGSKSNSSNE